MQDLQGEPNTGLNTENASHAADATSDERADANVAPLKAHHAERDGYCTPHSPNEAPSAIDILTKQDLTQTSGSLESQCVTLKVTTALEPRVRKLIPANDDALPLYVQTQGAMLGKSGNRLTIKYKDEALPSPLHEVYELRRTAGSRLPDR